VLSNRQNLTHLYAIAADAHDDEGSIYTTDQINAVKHADSHI